MALPSDAEILEIVRLHLAAEGLCSAPDEALPLHEAFTQSDEDKIEQIVRREIKGKAFEDRVLKLSKGILTQLFKNLYTRRSTWRDPLNTMAESIGKKPLKRLCERDDINKLAIPAAAKAYARRTSASMKDQPEQFLRVNAMLTNPGRKSRKFTTQAAGWIPTWKGK